MSVRRANDANTALAPRLALVLGAGMAVEPTGVKNSSLKESQERQAESQRRRDRVRLARQGGVTKYPHAPEGHYEPVEPPPAPTDEELWLAAMGSWSVERLERFATDVQQRLAEKKMYQHMHGRRMTVTSMDKVYALKRQGRTLYGFGDKGDKPPPTP